MDSPSIEKSGGGGVAFVGSAKKRRPRGGARKSQEDDDNNNNKANPSNKKRKNKSKKRKKKNGSSTSQQQQQSHQQQHQHQQQQIHLSHLKLTLRNIQNVEKHGTKRGMIDLISSIIHEYNQRIVPSPLQEEHSTTAVTSVENANAGSNQLLLLDRVIPPVPIEIDDDTIQRILLQKKVTVQKKLSKKQDSDGDDNTTDGGGEKENVTDQKENQKNQPNEGSNAEIMKIDNGEANNDNDKKEKKEETKDEEEKKHVITARILYVIPTRKSKRRGELPGHAYVVLYPPMPRFILEKLKPIEEIVDEKDVNINPQNDEDKKTDDNDGNKEKNALNDIDQVDNEGTANIDTIHTDMEQLHIDENTTMTKDHIATTTATTTTSNNEVEEAKDTENDDSNKKQITTTRATTTVMKVPKLTPDDRSKALAQARILLEETVSSLQRVCQMDGDSNTLQYHHCTIESSQNQKSWKNDYSLEQLEMLNTVVQVVEEDGEGEDGKGEESTDNTRSATVSGSGAGGTKAGGKRGGHGYNYHLKYESTIGDSDDFKKFMQKREVLEEERKNRPKPQPGGGGGGVGASSSSNATVITATSNKEGGKNQIVDENGQPIAALVLHLREKKALLKKKTAQKKSRGNSSRALSTSESMKRSMRKNNNTKGSSGGGGGLKSKKEGEKKRKKKRGTKTSSSTGGGSSSTKAGPSMILAKPGYK